VLYREPKLLKDGVRTRAVREDEVSVLYREPKLLKDVARCFLNHRARGSFSALP